MTDNTQGKGQTQNNVLRNILGTTARAFTLGAILTASVVNVAFADPGKKKIKKQKPKTEQQRVDSVRKADPARYDSLLKPMARNRMQQDFKRDTIAQFEIGSPLPNRSFEDISKDSWRSRSSMRFHPILKDKKDPTKPLKRMHVGEDTGAKYGTPIIAAIDGKIAKIKTSSEIGTTFAVEDIDENSGGEKKITNLHVEPLTHTPYVNGKPSKTHYYKNGYLHAGQPKLRDGEKAPKVWQVGDEVHVGDTLGYVGRPGGSGGTLNTSPHAHTEFQFNGIDENISRVIDKHGHAVVLAGNETSLHPMLQVDVREALFEDPYGRSFDAALEEIAAGTFGENGHSGLSRKEMRQTAKMLQAIEDHYVVQFMNAGVGEKYEIESAPVKVDTTQILALKPVVKSAPFAVELPAADSVVVDNAPIADQNNQKPDDNNDKSKINPVIHDDRRKAAQQALLFADPLPPGGNNTPEEEEEMLYAWVTTSGLRGPEIDALPQDVVAQEVDTANEQIKKEGVEKRSIIVRMMKARFKKLLAASVVKDTVNALADTLVARSETFEIDTEAGTLVAAEDTVATEEIITEEIVLVDEPVAAEIAQEEVIATIEEAPVSAVAEVAPQDAQPEETPVEELAKLPEQALIAADPASVDTTDNDNVDAAGQKNGIVVAEKESEFPVGAAVAGGLIVAGGLYFATRKKSRDKIKVLGLAAALAAGQASDAAPVAVNPQMETVAQEKTAAVKHETKPHALFKDNASQLTERQKNKVLGTTVKIMGNDVTLDETMLGVLGNIHDKTLYRNIRAAQKKDANGVEKGFGEQSSVGKVLHRDFGINKAEVMTTAFTMPEREQLARVTEASKKPLAQMALEAYDATRQAREDQIVRDMLQMDRIIEASKKPMAQVVLEAHEFQKKDVQKPVFA